MDTPKRKDDGGNGGQRAREEGRRKQSGEEPSWGLTASVSWCVCICVRVVCAGEASRGAYLLPTHLHTSPSLLPTVHVIPAALLPNRETMYLWSSSFRPQSFSYRNIPTHLGRRLCLLLLLLQLPLLLLLELFTCSPKIVREPIVPSQIVEYHVSCILVVV